MLQSQEHLVNWWLSTGRVHQCVATVNSEVTSQSRAQLMFVWFFFLFCSTYTIKVHYNHSLMQGWGKTTSCQVGCLDRRGPPRGARRSLRASCIRHAGLTTGLHCPGNGPTEVQPDTSQDDSRRYVGERWPRHSGRGYRYLCRSFSTTCRMGEKQRAELYSINLKYSLQLVSSFSFPSSFCIPVIVNKQPEDRFGTDWSVSHKTECYTENSIRNIKSKMSGLN